MLKKVLFMMLVMLVAALPALAQEDLTETFELSDFGFSIDYPEGWTAGENEDAGFFVIAAEEDDIEVAGSGDSPSGPVVIIIPLPEDVMESLGGSLEDVVDGVSGSIEYDEELTDGVEELELESGYEAFVSAGILADASYFATVAVTDDASAFVLIGSAPEDDVEDFELTFFAMLETIVIGEAEEGEEGEEGSTGGEVTIEYGDTVEGEITDDEFAVAYTFEAEEGDVVTITMIDVSDDGDLDPYIAILNEDGDVLEENDDAEEDIDSEDGFDSQIVEFEIEEDGTYVIVATRFGVEEGSGEGEFELTIEEGEGDGGEEEEGGDSGGGDAEGGVIEAGDTVSGEITDDAFAVAYTFEASEGDVVTVTVEATDGDLDTYVAILDENGDVLEENDDADDQVGDSGLNSQIEEFEIEEDGVYVIVVTRFGLEEGSSEGEYEVTLEIDN